MNQRQMTMIWRNRSPLSLTVTVLGRHHRQHHGMRFFSTTINRNEEGTTKEEQQKKPPSVSQWEKIVRKEMSRSSSPSAARLESFLSQGSSVSSLYSKDRQKRD
mmetsp:Transcript_541/g.686  ORF Transcript_541/g.686 Transcript_541/m.686 type:complete len:104 (+) Transcript_541:2-313(+)